MNWYENISISISYSPWILFLGIAIVIIFTLFIYKTTLPPINKLAKGLLIALRSMALLLILLLLFDPIAKISSSVNVEPENIVFIDNSKSIKQFSPSSEISNISELVDQLNSKLDGHKKIFTFGSNLEKINFEVPDSFNFIGSSTKFNQVIQQIKKSDNLSSVVIISDGILNDGKNPEHEINNISVPIYTIGIGDTSSSADLSIERIRTNKFIYADRESEVEVLLKNIDLANQIATVNLYVDETLYKTESIKLSPNGINRVKFPFISSIEGKHLITARTTINSDEKNKVNNAKTTLVNVLAIKKKIAIIAGSPSRDLSALTNSIKQNEEFDIKQFVELNKKTNYNNPINLNIIRDADLIFMIGFPSSSSDLNFIKEVESIISETNKPVFISLGLSVDYEKLKDLSTILPFNFSANSNKYNEVQVAKTSSLNGLLGKSENIKTAWQNLPPVSLNQTKIIPFVSAEVLLSDNPGGNYPILFTNISGSKKSVVLTTSNIWRWKLKNSDKDYRLFDNLVLNAIKWLSVNSDNEYFTVKVDKNNYRLGETITFNANLYDETYEPINNEQIELEIFDGSNKHQFKFTSVGNGIYEANIDLMNPGLIKFKASLTNNSRNLPAINGSMNIEPIELELVESKLNKRFLENISNITGGKYFNINETEDLIDELNSNYQNKIYQKNIDEELRLSSFELILLIIVLLFSVEWVTRKFFKMI
jgi:hypothetical protein